MHNYLKGAQFLVCLPCLYADMHNAFECVHRWRCYVIPIHGLLQSDVQDVSDRIFITEFGGNLNVANLNYEQPTNDNNVRIMNFSLITCILLFERSITSTTQWFAAVL